ncbi:MAG: pilus assembly protein, partial [Acidobacteria bacterium]|nr:pilus assembly protein [Acidobacteriota bacterium]
LSPKLWRCQRGQQTLEYVIVYAGVLMPVTFAIIFTALVLWVWHSVIDFARDGAHYAATHCWQAAADNVIEYMHNHVPFTIDRGQFQTAGTDVIQIQYFSRDSESGNLVEFACDQGECSTGCVPDVVTVRIQGYEYRHAFLTSLGLPPIAIPDFRTSLAIESAGCDPEQGACFP